MTKFLINNEISTKLARNWIMARIRANLGDWTENLNRMWWSWIGNICELGLFGFARMYEKEHRRDKKEMTTRIKLKGWMICQEDALKIFVLMLEFFTTTLIFDSKAYTIYHDEYQCFPIRPTTTNFDGDADQHSTR